MFYPPFGSVVLSFGVLVDGDYISSGTWEVGLAVSAKHGVV